MAGLRILWQDSEIYQLWHWVIFYGWLGTGFDGYADGITFRFDKGIDLGCSDECCSDGNIEFLFKWFQDGINGGICWCVAGCSVTVYDWYK